MNGGSFSTSTEFLSILHFHKRATFVGQETGGACYSLTAGRFVDVILPHSKLQLMFGLSTYYQAVSGHKHPDRGIMPDHSVTYTIDDLLAGKDKEMELALALARDYTDCCHSEHGH
jgi:C-terminal processing protease CtpA/Prc